MFESLCKPFAYLNTIGKLAEQREIEAYLANTKTLEQLEQRQRALECSSTYTHFLSGWRSCTH
jgi:hypothetical protein